MAAAYAALYPLPNRPGTVGNYFTNQLRPYDYNACMGRVDHNFTAANRLFAHRLLEQAAEDRYNWAQDAANATDGGSINGFPVTQGFDYRSNTGVTGGYTLGALVAHCCSTCAAAGRASASGATRRRTSIRRSWASRRRRCS